ncbi:MAG TPA: hypothetical protein VFB25_04365 [Gaiellaceae bacterium]|nr:hypothetical protein [Gaiellaceae bacterium]
MPWRRLWDARLTWKTLPLLTGGVIGVMSVAYLIPSNTAANVWVGLVAFLGVGLLAKTGENDTRRRIAEAPTGTRLPWWVSRKSLAFPWWAGWLAASAVVGVAVAVWACVSGSWAVVVYFIGVALLGLVRRRTIRAAKAGGE